MKISALALVAAIQSASAFAPHARTSKPTFALKGYLDDLSQELYAEDPNPVPEDESREATKMNKEDVENYSVGSWEGFVEFDEFDGGDGQMGVAGDGSGNKLESFDMSEVGKSMNKSRARSAKNAWGTSSGYADELIDQGVDTQRAQQLENWHSQQEVSRQKKQQQYMTESYDQVDAEDDNWRNLAKFGVERTQDFDLDAEFGTVAAGDLEGTIEVTARMNGFGVHEFPLRNEYMGFADFRAAFTPDTVGDWTIEPNEGALKQREDTNFLVRFRGNSPGVSEGYLVIETEDFKKTWKVIGSTA